MFRLPVKNIKKQFCRNIHFSTPTNDIFSLIINKKFLNKNDLLRLKQRPELCVSSKIYGFVGVTTPDYNKLGEIVYKDFYDVENNILRPNDTYLQIETVKASTDFITPIGGKCKQIFEDGLVDNNTHMFLHLELSINDMKDILKNITDFTYHN